MQWFAGFLAAAPLYAVAAQEIQYQPATVQVFDGRTATAELGRLAVTAGQSGRRFTIGFYRFRSTAARPGSPVVFLMGGPGVPATLMARVPPYWTLFDQLRSVGDVILVDYRGLGESSPTVDCPAPLQPIHREFLRSNGALLETMGQVYGACADRWRSEGIEPADFTIERVTDDLEVLRQALGVPRLSLIGFSYGSRIALEMVRRHPGSVDRLVLQGVLGPDHTARMPSTFEAAFERMASLAAADSGVRGFARTLRTDLLALLDQVAREDLVVRFAAPNGDSVTVSIGVEGLQTILVGRITDPRMPALIATLRDGDTSVLARMVETVYRDLSAGGGSLMARALTCSSPSTPATHAKAMAESLHSNFGYPFDNLIVEAGFCRRLGIAPSATDGRVASDRPTLFISGTLDDRTPPGNVEQLLPSFPNGRHLVVNNGGHELLVYPFIQDAVVRFLSGRTPASLQAEVSRPRFLPIAEARLPPRRPGT